MQRWTAQAEAATTKTRSKAHRQLGRHLHEASGHRQTQEKGRGPKRERKKMVSFPRTIGMNTPWVRAAPCSERTLAIELANAQKCADGIRQST